MVACDLCYSRKVKCDQQDPCLNCILAKCSCLRTRSRWASRQKNRPERNDTQIDSPLDTNRSTPVSGPDTGYPEKKRKRTVDPLATPDSNCPPDIEAHTFIQNELSLGSRLSTHQRATLEASLSLVDRLSQASTTEEADTLQDTHDVDIELSRPEILHIVMMSKSPAENAVNCSPFLQFPDFLPARTLERMGLALLSNTVSEQIALQYKIVLHFKAAVLYHVDQMKERVDLHLNSHLNDTRSHHLRAAIAALDRIRFRTPPSLSLLQAQLASAVILQIFGDTSGSRTLTVAASRTLVALGYHNITKSDTRPETDEINACVAWCYMLDKNLAMLMFRPPTLPQLPVKVTSLILPITSRSESNSTILFLELAQAQEAALSMTGMSSLVPNSIAAGLDTIRRDMQALYPKILRGLESCSESARIRLLPWGALELKFNSVMTSILRISPKIASDMTLQTECLYWARRALQSLLSLQEAALAHDPQAGVSCLYLTWTLSSYPLCPMFVVFCNIVRTGNHRDFRILQQLDANLTFFSNSDRFITRLRNLHATLINLCAPLVADLSEHSGHPETAPDTNVRLPESPVSVDEGDFNPSHISPESECPHQSMDSTSTQVGSMTGAFGNDELMWQLFSASPSAEWFDANILDSVLF